PEPSKLPLTYGSGVSEGSTTKKTGQGKTQHAKEAPPKNKLLLQPFNPHTTSRYHAHLMTNP
ncbi:MAG: hypothetical protein DRR11_18845, partial [Gammaproteobacteria bacterium]